MPLGKLSLPWINIYTVVNYLGDHSIYVNLLWLLIFIDSSYTVISSTKFCGHVQGGYPAFCYINLPFKILECEEKCTSFDWCIAYSVNSLQCNLMTTTRSCPSGWYTHLGSTAHIATKISDLIPAVAPGGNCMAKGIA